MKIPNPIVNARKNYVQKECRLIRLKILSSMAFLGEFSDLLKLFIMQNANDWRTKDALSTKKTNPYTNSSPSVKNNLLSDIILVEYGN